MVFWQSESCIWPKPSNHLCFTNAQDTKQMIGNNMISISLISVMTWTDNAPLTHIQKLYILILSNASLWFGKY